LCAVRLELTSRLIPPSLNGLDSTQDTRFNSYIPRTIKKTLSDRQHESGAVAPTAFTSASSEDGWEMDILSNHCGDGSQPVL